MLGNDDHTNAKSTAQTIGTGLTALGCGGADWRALIESAYSRQALTVAGELADGQLLHYSDDSGVWFALMTAPPYAALCGFESTASVVDCSITMMNDSLALLTLLADDEQPIMDVTAHLAQGPLLVDEDDHPDRVTITGLGLRVAVEDHPEGGRTQGSVTSIGADTIARGDGSTGPTAEADVTLPILAIERRTMSLTGEEFLHAAVAAPFPMDVCLPISMAEVAVPGRVLTGRFLLTAQVAAPAGCSDSCGCGSGGCGGSCG